MEQQTKQNSQSSEHIFSKKRKIIAVVGKTGYGKSYFVNSFVYDINRVVIFDTMNEYNHPDFIEFKDLDEFIDHAKEVGFDYSQNFKVILKFEEPEEYNIALDIVYTIGGLTVVLEEVHFYASAKSILPVFEKIIRLGRHRNISIIGITQRFGDLHLIYRNNLDAVIAFNLSAPNDIKYLSEISYIGDDAEKISQLPKWKHLIFQNF